MFTSLLASLALAAQPQVAAPPPSDQEAIVIEAQRLEKQRQQISRMVDALTDSTFEGQVPQFHEALCPLVVGLDPEPAGDVEARLRTVADAIGLGAADASCTANLLVVVTDDREAVLDYWKRKKPDIFWNLDRKEKEALFEDDAPVLSWQLIMMLDNNMMPVQQDVQSGVYTVASTDVTRMRTSMLPSARGAVVVVDKTKLAGLDVRQLADHVAMRALAPLDPDAVDELASPTILKLMNAGLDDTVPLTMTDWDFAFLKALYGTDNARKARSMRRRLASAMDKSLEAAADMERD